MLEFIDLPLLILLLSVPVVAFVAGFLIGKRTGYAKRIKETEL